MPNPIHPSHAPRHTPAPLWPYALVAILYLVALGVLASTLRAHFGFPLDDSWIHQSVARNLAHNCNLGYLPHQRSSGSTSLLWTLLLAANYLILPHVAPILFTLAINAACLVAIGLMLLRLSLRDGLPVPLAILLAAAPAADGNFVWLAFTGMEHLLFLALSLAAILLWLPTLRASRQPSVPSALAAGLLLGLLALTRPEGIVLAILLLPAFRLFRRTLREALAAAAVTLALAVVPFTLSLITSRTLLPVTFKGRQWLYFAGNAPGLTYRIQLFAQWCTRPVKALLPFDGSASAPAVRVLVLAGIALVLAFAALDLYALWTRRRTGLLVLAAWAAVHSLLYLVILPVSGHAGRYQPFLLLLLAPVLAGAYTSATRIPSPGLRVALPAAACLAFAAVSLPLWRTVLAAGIDHIAQSHGVMAAYLEREHVASPLAVFDIGRIGYARNDDVVDLGGLTDPAYVAFLTSGQVPQYLSQHGIRAVVLPEQPDGRSFVANELQLAPNPALTLTPIYRACTPEATWQLAWIETRNASQCQTLYRITFR